MTRIATLCMSQGTTIGPHSIASFTRWRLDGEICMAPSIPCEQENENHRKSDSIITVEGQVPPPLCASLQEPKTAPP
ncbi:hypothetical protein Peur_012395 [Populus x canadensis]